MLSHQELIPEVRQSKNLNSNYEFEHRNLFQEGRWANLKLSRYSWASGGIHQALKHKITNFYNEYYKLNLFELKVDAVIGENEKEGVDGVAL